MDTWKEKRRKKMREIKQVVCKYNLK
jgi:hypothetical protein